MISWIGIYPFHNWFLHIQLRKYNYNHSIRQYTCHRSRKVSLSIRPPLRNRKKYKNGLITFDKIIILTCCITIIDKWYVTKFQCPGSFCQVIFRLCLETECPVSIQLHDLHHRTQRSITITKTRFMLILSEKLCNFLVISLMALKLNFQLLPVSQLSPSYPSTQEHE